MITDAKGRDGKRQVHHSESLKKNSNVLSDFRKEDVAWLHLIQMSSRRREGGELVNKKRRHKKVTNRAEFHTLSRRTRVLKKRRQAFIIIAIVY